MAINPDSYISGVTTFEEAAERTKTGFGRWLIRNLARLSILLVAYPAVDFIFNAFMSYAPGDVWLLTVMCVLCGLICCGVCSLVYRSGNEKLVVFVRVLLGVVFAVGFVFLSFIPASNNYPIISAMIFPVYGIVFSIIGGGLSMREMAPRDFGICTVAYVISFVGLNAQTAVYSVNTFIWLYLFMSVIYAIQRNYDKIDLLMSRRGHNKAKLPGSIRGFNLLLLGIVFIAGLFFVLFRTFFAGILEDVFTSIVFIVALFFQLIFNKLLLPLVEAFFLGKHQATPGKGGLETIDLEGLLGLEETTSFADNPLYVFTIVLAACFTVFVLAYYLGKPLMKWLSKRFSKLAMFLRKHLYRNSNLKGSFAGDDNEYYSEVNESIEAADTKSEEDEDPSNREIRRWRGKLRDYEKMPKNADTFLYGYRLGSKGLALKGVPIRPSDTALEVLAKAGGVVEGSGFDAVTDRVNAITFDDRNSGTDFESLDSALEKIKDYKPEPKKKKAADQDDTPRKWWQRKK